jgi:hypothetical protein
MHKGSPPLIWHGKLPDEVMCELGCSVDNEGRGTVAGAADNVQETNSKEVHVVFCALAHHPAQPLHRLVSLELSLKRLRVDKSQAFLGILLVGEAAPVNTNKHILSREMLQKKADRFLVYSLARQLERLDLQRHTASPRPRTSVYPAKMA